MERQARKMERQASCFIEIETSKEMGNTQERCFCFVGNSIAIVIAFGVTQQLPRYHTLSSTAVNMFPTCISLIEQLIINRERSSASSRVVVVIALTAATITR
jgi:hypothetical protein